MLRNWSEFLSKDDVDQVHHTSMKILANVGIQFHQSEALNIFKDHGARVDGHKVFLTEAQVMKAVEQVPARFTLHARNPERNVTVGNGVPVFAPAYGAPFVIDPDIGRRMSTMEDYHNLAMLAHALPNQDLSGHLLVEPRDVPPETSCLYMLHASITHSDKPFVGGVAGRMQARHTLEMASILFGEMARQKPVTIGLVSSLSPMSYGSEMIEALLEYARANQPVIVATVLMAGSTGPITLEGVLAQQNAEILAGITLAQLINPGTPVVYGSTSANMDMRTGAFSIGGPELALIVVATAQMARYYGIPSRSGGSLTDANSVDSQAGFESMFSLLTTVTSGIDFVLHAAGVMSSYLGFSYEKFVLDDEMCSMVRRFRHGLTVTPETLAYEVIAKVGPGGNFLIEPHTLAHCRHEFWHPSVSYREAYDTWLTVGRPDANQRARQRCQELLAAHQDPPLETITARQLQAFVDKHTQ